MRRQPGFTLIELMIAVAIIAILAAIAVPSYTEYIRRGRVSDATSQLAGMRIKMEQYFQDQRTYQGACTAGTVAPKPASTPSFTFDCPAANLTATTYVVEAIGIGSMAPAKYTIDQAGARKTETAPGGWLGTGNACWVVKKDGSC